MKKHKSAKKKKQQVYYVAVLSFIWNGKKIVRTIQYYYLFVTDFAAILIRECGTCSAEVFDDFKEFKSKIVRDKKDFNKYVKMIKLK